MTDPQVTQGKRLRPGKRPNPSLGSRFFITGAALGGGLAMVGTMAAAAGASENTEPSNEATTVRRITVVPQATAEPIYVLLPQAGSETTTPQVLVVDVPAPATAPNPAQTQLTREAAPAPVTESGGS